MMELALHYGEGPIYLKEIARRQNIPDKYLGNLILPLKTAGLIRAERGAHGGYYLARKPDEITMKDVVEALEGSLSLVECVETPGACSRSADCPSHDLWSAVSEKMANTLQSITLKQFAEKYKNKTPKSIYYI